MLLYQYLLKECEREELSQRESWVRDWLGAELTVGGFFGEQTEQVPLPAWSEKPRRANRPKGSLIDAWSKAPRNFSAASAGPPLTPMRQVGRWP